MWWWLASMGYLAVGMGVGRIVYVRLDKDSDNRDMREIGGSFAVGLWPFVVLFALLAAGFRLTIGRPTPREVEVQERRKSRQLDLLQSKMDARNYDRINYPYDYG